MDRRRFLLTSLAGAVAAPLAVGAQQVGKIYRIGYLAAVYAPRPDMSSPKGISSGSRVWQQSS